MLILFLKKITATILRVTFPTKLVFIKGNQNSRAHNITYFDIISIKYLYTWIMLCIMRLILLFTVGMVFTFPL